MAGPATALQGENSMTILLASVQNPQEAQIAAQSGAGIIDIKDPKQGGLAATDHTTWQKIAQQINHKAPISATMGNPPQATAQIINKAQQASQAKIDIVKIGIASNDKKQIEEIANQAQHIAARVVLVYLIDQTQPQLPENTQHIAAVMLDTRHKQSAKLTEILSTKQIQQFIQQAHHKQLQAGLAGKLDQQDIKQLLKLNPDIIGVRSAITQTSRDSNLDHNKIEQLARLFPQQNPQQWYCQNTADTMPTNNIAMHCPKMV